MRISLFSYRLYDNEQDREKRVLGYENVEDRKRGYENGEERERGHESYEVRKGGYVRLRMARTGKRVRGYEDVRMTMIRGGAEM